MRKPDLKIFLKTLVHADVLLINTCNKDASARVQNNILYQIYLFLLCILEYSSLRNI